MLRPLRDHIVSLEIQIQSLLDQLTDLNLTPEERVNVQSKIDLAQLALSRYKEAFYIEQKIA